MTFDLYIGQGAVGTVAAESDGSRVRLTAAAPMRGDGIYKAFLSGDGGKLAVGVMMPQNGEMIARRSVPEREYTALGTIRQGEAVMTVRFEPAGSRAAAPTASAPSPGPDAGVPEADDSWVPEPQAFRLFSDPSVSALWVGMEHCFRKTIRDGTLLAAELQEEAPFAPVPMFCLGQSRTVRGKNCIVFKINPAGHPVPAE